MSLHFHHESTSKSEEPVIYLLAVHLVIEIKLLRVESSGKLLFMANYACVLHARTLPLFLEHLLKINGKPKLFPFYHTFS